MTRMTRRTTLGLAVAALTTPPPLRAAADPAANPSLSGTAIAAAWHRVYAAAPGETFAWWQAGTLYAHVDGLREFPVVGWRASTIGRRAPEAAERIDWRTYGWFTDLEREGHATSWDNPFTGTREPLPPRFTEGPGQYRVSAAGAAVAFTMQASRVRANRTLLTGALAEGRLLLTQVEGTLQGLPGANGELPALDSPAVTERQTRLQFVAPESVLGSTADGWIEARGFFNHVYDALPGWLGFGDRLGSALSKGVMRKTRGDAPLDPASGRQLRRLFPAAFHGSRLREP